MDQKFQFNPEGLVDSSKNLNSVEGGIGLQTLDTNPPQAMPSSEISKKLQGLKG